MAKFRSLPTAREITAHRVNGLNEKLRIFVLDAPGSGGACHEYAILVPVSADDEMCYEHNPPRITEHNSQVWRICDKPAPPNEIAGTNLIIGTGSFSSADFPGLAILRDFDSYNQENIDVYYNVTMISFQNGPIKENGVNGISQEALIAVLIDRLEGFQTGEFKCHDNQVALDHLQGSRLWLHKRTMDRVARNVEGTLQK
jgi:hypothetical protein